jgi:hypothetical protein
VILQLKKKGLSSMKAAPFFIPEVFIPVSVTGSSAHRTCTVPYRCGNISPFLPLRTG